MIVIKTKKGQTILDERNVATIDYYENRGEAWIRFPKPDGKFESISYDKVLGVEYRPNTEAFTLTKNGSENDTEK